MIDSVSVPLTVPWSTVVRVMTMDELARLPFPKPEPAFWIVLAENHERTFPDRPYNFARFVSERDARGLARRLSRLYPGDVFHVLQHVASQGKGGQDTDARMVPPKAFVPQCSAERDLELVNRLLDESDPLGGGYDELDDALDWAAAAAEDATWD